MLTFSLCFLSLFLFSTWYQSHFLVAFTRQNPVFLRCYGFTVSSPRSQTLSPFLPFSESSSPSCCLTQNHLHWIDLIKIYPLPPKSAGSSPACAPTRHQKFLALQPRAHAPPRAARSFWLSGHARTCSHAPRALTRSHAPHAPTRLTRFTLPRASRSHTPHAPHAPTRLTRPTRPTRLTLLSPSRRRSPLTAGVDQKKKKKHCPSRFFA